MLCNVTNRKTAVVIIIIFYSPAQHKTINNNDN